MGSNASTQKSEAGWEEWTVFFELYDREPSLDQVNSMLGDFETEPPLKPRALTHYKKLYRFYQQLEEKYPALISWDYKTHNDLARTVRDQKLRTTNHQDQEPTNERHTTRRHRLPHSSHRLTHQIHARPHPRRPQLRRRNRDGTRHELTRQQPTRRHRVPPRTLIPLHPSHCRTHNGHRRTLRRNPTNNMDQLRHRSPQTTPPIDDAISQAAQRLIQDQEEIGTIPEEGPHAIAIINWTQPTTPIPTTPRSNT